MGIVCVYRIAITSVFDVLLFDVLILAACRSRLKRGVLLFVVNFAV
jgi:hypothetical protein